MEMEVRSQEVDVIKNRVVTTDNLQLLHDEIMCLAPPEIAARIFQEISAVVSLHQMQTLSWTLLLVELDTPICIDKLSFYEIGLIVSFDRKEIYSSKIRLIRKLSRQDIEIQYPDSAFLKRWQSEKQPDDEFWEYETSFGPPEWGVGIGIALTRKGKIISSHHTDCSF